MTTRNLLLIGLLGLDITRATPLPTGEFQGGELWFLPGNERGIFLEGGKSAMQEIGVPPLSDKEKSAGGDWRGLVAVDFFGVAGEGVGEIDVELVEPQTGAVLARAGTTGEAKAPRAWWSVISSSGQPGEVAAFAFDGDAGTKWHSRYSDEKAEAPHWAGIEFGEPQRISGVSYLPRPDGTTNGVAKDYRIELRKPGGEWELVAAGTTDKKSVAEERKPVEVPFAEPMEVKAFRFVIASDWGGGNFGSAAEIVPLGLKLPEKDRAMLPHSRIWLEIPAEKLKALDGKTFAVRAKATSGSAVIGETKFCRVHSAPSERHLGKANGASGPDRIGAGLLGFEAITEQDQYALSVMTVREGSPAAQAGLVAGDAIVAVAGKPFHRNDLNPGWDWFGHSQEATLGREIEAAISSGKNTIQLGVVRGGRVQTLDPGFSRNRAFTTMNPVDDEETAALLADLITWLVKNQKQDGSWNGNNIQTAFAALALLATEDKAHEAAVKRAVDWTLAKYPEPEKYGKLGFWAGSYAGILYAEWHLRSGDERVLPQMEALRDWVTGGKHISRWGIPALGHGPSELPYEMKGLTAPACQLLVFEALAMRCGMESAIWEMILPYMELSWSDPAKGGHGSLGYNQKGMDQGEFWSRTGLFAMVCELRGQRADMKDAMTTYMPTRHPWFRNSHAYGEPGGALGLLGLNLAAPDTYAKIIKEYTWWFSLAWEPGYGIRHTTPHMGSPYMGEEELLIPAYALVLQGPKKSLHLTGKR